MTRFSARAVAAQELDDLATFAVVLSENEDGSGARLEIQRALEEDEQDRALGMDTYCLCVESGATHYGGVERWSLDGATLRVDLDARAKRALGADGFEIEMAVSGEQLIALRAGLVRLLGAPR